MKAKLIDNLEILQLLKDKIEAFGNEINYKCNYLIDEDNPTTLGYAIYVKKRFCEPNGALSLIFDDNKIVALSGVEKSDTFGPEVALIGRRTSYLPEYRNQCLFSDLILPDQIKWCAENDYKVGLFTFNHDRLALFKRFKKLQKGIYKERLKCFDKTYKIYNTDQYIAAYMIDKDFDWDPEENANR